MELLGKVIVYPILWIVYIMLPFLNGPLSSLQSFTASFAHTVVYFTGFYEILCRAIESPHDICVLAGFYFFVLLPLAVDSWYIVDIISSDSATHNSLVSILLVIAVHLAVAIWIISFNLAALMLPIPFFFILFVTALFPSVECLLYFLRLFIYLVMKAVTHIFIVGLKNRRACQFLSALAAVLLGVTKAKVYTIIPVAYGIFLTIPDLDPDPWMSFKLRFAHFLMANLDEESLNAVLYSTSFKMVSCNEMMPVLRPVRPTTTMACFVHRERFANEDGHFTVEPEYKIGLGSITTASRQDEIDVQIFTPYSGVKKRTMKNTPRARFNLDMSARFWRDHPEVGISNQVIRAHVLYDEAEIHCISIDQWITFCSSQNYVFMDYDCGRGTYL